MIEVTTLLDGDVVDSAEAESAEAALVAARVLWDELDGMRYAFGPSVEFHVDGQLVRRLKHRP